ncbi:MAG: hypothetical protein IKF79_02570 [Methanosphaera sp.]|nr:hypothetical protein [Methanosphaera sp.]
MTDEEPIVNEEPTTTNDEPTVDLWISVDDVIAFHGLKPQHLNINKNDNDADDQLAAIVTNWIIQSQDLINMYCNRNYTSSTVRPAVQNIALRLTSNMVRLAVQNRDSPIIKVNDWTITTVPSDIFTDDLKEDLKPFIKDSSTEPDSIGVLAITGSDD